MSPVGAVDLKRELKVCDEVMETVIFVIDELSTAVDDDLQNPLVHAAWLKTHRNRPLGFGVHRG